METCVKSKSIGYKDLLKEKNYMLSLCGSLISRFGDSIDVVAYGWLVYKLTGSKTLLASLYAINYIPNILLQPIAGVMASYFKKKTLIILSNIGRSLVVFLTAILFFFNLLKPWHLFIFTFLNSTFESINLPAGTALYPMLLPKEKISYGLGLSQTSSKIAEFIGLVSAGAIISILGISGAILIDSASFAIYALIIGFINVDDILKEKGTSVSYYFNDLKDGFNYLKNEKVIFNICLFGAILSVLLIPINSLNVAYVNDVVKGTPNTLSMMSIALLLGLMMGSYVFPKLQEKFSLQKIFIFSGVFIGINYIFLASVNFIFGIKPVILMLIASFFLAFFGGLMSVLINILFMTKISKEYLSRCSGIFNAIVSSVIPIASFLIATLCKVLSLEHLFIACGIFIILLFLTQIFNKCLKSL